MTKGGEYLNFHIPYGDADQIADQLIGVLKGTPLGLGMVGMLLAIARLSQGDELDQEEEVKFIEDASSFLGAYWGNHV